jgi:hypothetical protein
MVKTNIYATPKVVTDLQDCIFYHTMYIPGYGEVDGYFDLRGGENDYLGGIYLTNKRVLEIGPANGFLSFYMERQGAEIVSYDLSDEHAWDTVPYSRINYPDLCVEHRRIIHKLNNGYWLAHRAYQSQARVVYGSVYNIPAEIGPVDISTFGMVLLHVQNPFLALQNALRLTRETVVITELVPNWLQRTSKPWKWFLCRRMVPKWSVVPETLSNLFWRNMAFEPNFHTCKDPATWWTISPQTIRNYLGVLGFEDTRLNFHVQRYKRTNVIVYTIVGTRTNQQTW